MIRCLLAFLTIGVGVMAIAAATAALPAVTFTDVTQSAGIRFVHNSGAFGRKYLPETMGAGSLFLDADGDGWQDILLVNSMNWPGREGAKSKSYPTLYRNNHNATFTDVTRGSGLEVELYGIGAAAADFDNAAPTDAYGKPLGGKRTVQ